MTEKEKAFRAYEVIETTVKEKAQRQGISAEELEWYFTPSDDNEHNAVLHIWEYEHEGKIGDWKQKAMMSFVFHAQNQTGTHINNIVKYDPNIEFIYQILKKFKPSEILNSYRKAEELVDAFRNVVDANGKRVFVWKENPDNPDFAIGRWCESILGSASLIERFQTRNDLLDYMKLCLENSEDERGEFKNKINLNKLSRSFGVPGLGTALVCDLFKEFDPCFSTIIKPDLHIKDFLDAYDGLSDGDGKYQKNDTRSYHKILKIVDLINAEKPNLHLSPYKFDKMIWLVCSGDFYMNKSKGKRELLNEISNLNAR